MRSALPPSLSSPCWPSPGARRSRRSRRPPPTSFPRELVETGETLASAGNCIDCHTAPGGPANAGGKSIHTKIGNFYSTNITPDPETGIGAWSEAAFARALREGVSRDGRHLFPVFPYTHYTQLTDADVRALYAYFMTRPPVKAPNRPNTLYFPIDVRPLQAVWKSLFFKPGPYRRILPAIRDGTAAPISPRRWPAVPSATPTATCSAPSRSDIPMPAPRSMAGMRHRSTSAPRPRAGARKSSSPILRRGESPPHGVALGPMRAVVRNLARMPDDDLQAMATYFISLNSPSGRAARSRDRPRARAVPPATDQQRAGQKIYWSIVRAAMARRAARLRRAIAARPDRVAVDAYRPYNLLLTVLNGIDGRDGLPGSMPGFRDKLSDEDIEALAIYLRASHTTLPIWGLLAERINARAQRSVVAALRFCL